MKPDINKKKIYIVLFSIFIVLLIIAPEIVNENSKIAIYKKDPNKIYLKSNQKNTYATHKRQSTRNRQNGQRYYGKINNCN